jgi:hypothetical protein
MERVTIETPAQWLEAKKIAIIAKKLRGDQQKLPSLYIKEVVVYEFYKWSVRKARFTGVVIGLAIAVAIAAIVKLMGI